MLPSLSFFLPSSSSSNLLATTTTGVEDDDTASTTSGSPAHLNDAIAFAAAVLFSSSSSKLPLALFPSSHTIPLSTVSFLSKSSPSPFFALDAESSNVELREDENFFLFFFLSRESDDADVDRSNALKPCALLGLIVLRFRSSSTATADCEFIDTQNI